MKELLRTNDVVMISWVQAALADDGIETIVFDQFVSAIEGYAGPVQRRVMVANDDFERAQWIVKTQSPEVTP
jgi:Putative prokaryotic signal transducing protein